jgi:Domain of unknown function (DUF397)
VNADLIHAAWRKSTHSGTNGNCVEVAGLPGVVAVRDSKDPDGPALVIGPRDWSVFAAKVKSGRLGLSSGQCQSSRRAPVVVAGALRLYRP